MWPLKITALALTLLPLVVSCSENESQTPTAKGPETRSAAAQAEPQIVSGADFQQQVLASSEPVLVDFYADWCPPCKVLSPKLDRLAQEYVGKVKFVKIDVDGAAELSRRFAIEAIPTVIIFVEGKEAHRLRGNRSAGDYRAVLDRIIGQ